MTARRAPLVALLAGLGAGAWFLAAVRASVWIQPPDDGATWDPARGGPALAALVVWFVAAGLTTWLAVATVSQLLASMPRGRLLQPLADLISPRSLQRLGRGLAGLSLTAGLAAPAPGAGTPTQAAPPTTVADADPPTTPDTTTATTTAGTATIRPLDAVPAPTGPTPVPPEVDQPAEPGGTATVRVLVEPDLPVAPPAVPVAVVPPTPAPTTPLPTGAASTAAPAPPAEVDPGPLPETGPTAEPGGTDASQVVVVRPGDSFWSIAEAEVHRRTGRPGDEPTVARLWRRLIEVNRDQVIDPDLIHPGQVLRIPGP